MSCENFESANNNNNVSRPESNFHLFQQTFPSTGDGQRQANSGDTIYGAPPSGSQVLEIPSIWNQSSESAGQTDLLPGLQAGGCTDSGHADFTPDDTLSTIGAQKWFIQSELQRDLSLDTDRNDIYTVKPGDSLWTIAQRELRDEDGADPSNKQITSEIAAIRGENTQLDCNQNWLSVGAQIHIPGKSGVSEQPELPDQPALQPLQNVGQPPEGPFHPQLTEAAQDHGTDWLSSIKQWASQFEPEEMLSAR